MPSADWTDLIATDPDGEALGRVEDVYVDPESGEPEFVLVRTSELGGLRHRHVLVPAHRARETGDTLELPYTAGRVREAPDADQRTRELTPDHERDTIAFFEHGTTEGVDVQGRRERGDDAASVVLHEERVEIGWRVRDAERVRIRKRIIEEEVTLKVRLRREDLEVVREPIADSGGGVIDETHLSEQGSDLPEEMVLYGEEPVVEVRVVPRERVRFGRQVVTERVTIQETVRREDARLQMTAPGDANAPGRPVD